MSALSAPPIRKTPVVYHTHVMPLREIRGSDILSISVNGPAEITREELTRLQHWLEFAFIVVDAKPEQDQTV